MVCSLDHAISFKEGQFYNPFKTLLSTEKKIQFNFFEKQQFLMSFVTQRAHREQIWPRGKNLIGIED